MDGAFSHWSASWPVLAGYVLVAGAHLVGLRRLLAAGDGAARTAGATSEQLRREALVFQGGLLLVALALLSPAGYWATVYLWVRALQALCVAVIGPGLLVLGAPWPAFGQLRRRAPAEVPGAGQDGVAPGPAPWLVARPALAVVAFNVVFVGWQLPGLYDAVRTGGGLALIEHVMFVAAGMLFWFQLISSRPLSQQTPPVRRMAMLVGTVGVSTVLGMVLVFGSGVVYSGYANPEHHIMTVLDDQQLSGAVLWMGMLPPLIVAGVALLMAWLGNEDSADLSAGLDRLLTQRRHGWPSRPVIR